MKRFSLIMVGILLCLSINSCSNDDDDSNGNNNGGSTTGVLVDGTWKITLFQEDNNDQTNHFTGFALDFESNGVLTASNGSITYTGIWNNGGDDSGNKLNIDFPTAPDDDPFEEISEDWQILTKNSSKIALRHVSGGDGSIDLLTFEKN